MSPQHWSVDDEPADPTPANAGLAVPPPQPPVERAVELIESLFNLERDLTAELLAVLARCSLEDLSKMFNVAMPAATPMPEPTPADVSTMDTSKPRGPSWMTPALRSQQQKPDSGAWQWDSSGRRIGNLPSSFPRQYEPPRRPPGATWMSD
jgi:hypothetical protein